jgi:hypothetical protein
MTLAVLIIFVLVGLVGAVVALGLRRTFLEEQEVETRVRTGGAHGVEYAVPEGIDVADLRAAVAAAGFSSAVLDGHAGRRLRVVCPEHDRSRVRVALEEAHSSASGDVPLHLEPVVFVDEQQSST